MSRTCQLKLDSMTGAGSSLVVDGHDLSAVTRGVSLAASVGSRPILIVQLALDRIELDGQVQVRLRDDVHNTLVELGWTPPAFTVAGLAAEPTADELEERAAELLTRANQLRAGADG